MPTTPIENEILGFEVEADASAATKSIEKFMRGMSKAIRQNAGEYKKLTGDVTRYDRVLASLHKKAIAADMADLKNIKEKIKRVEDLRSVDEDRLKRVTKLTEAGMKAEKEAAKKGLEKVEGRLEAFKKAGEALAAPLQAILAKDLPGAFQASGNIAAKIIEHGFKGAGTGLTKVGTKFGEWGSKALAKGAARKEAGKAGGGAMGAMGKTLQGVGKMAETIGPLVKTLATIGPIVMSLTAVIVGVIKLFVDAEAAAKDLNKEILATAGSSEFLEQNMGNSVAGASELDDVLGKIRDQATSLDNLDWGINKETHTAVLSNLTAQGVSLKKLNDRFDELGKGVIKTEGFVKSFGSMVQMTVGYSRAFGVSVGELSQLQGEMMGDIGMNLEGVQSQFEYMIKSAQAAGVATNKFFGIIRSFSADLTLFTLRMEDITKVTRVLMKTMDPRQAQKFLQTLTAHFKGMGLRERLKATIIGGTGATKGIVQKDINSRLDALGNDIENSLGPGTGKELITLIKSKDPKKREKLTKWMAQHQDKLDGKTRGAILDASRMQGKVDTGNAVDLASALKDVSPVAALEQLQAQSQTLFKKPLEDLTGVERIAAETAIGMSDEQVDQLSKMKAGLDQMQADLVEKLKNHAELTADEKKQLQKMGVDEKDGNAANLLAAKSGNDIWASMSMDQKDMLESGNKTLQYEKDIADRQTSIMDKLGILVDFIMNQVYNILVDTVDGIEGLLHPLDAALTSAKRQIRLSKDPALMDALAQHGASGEDLQKALLKTPVFKDIDDNMGKLYKEYKDAAQEEKTTTDQARKKELQAKKAEISGKLTAAVSRADITGGVSPDKVKDALKTTSISADKINAIMKDMKENGTNFSSALFAAGTTEDQRVDAMKAVYKKMDAYELSLYSGSLKKAGWGTTGTPPPGTATATAGGGTGTPNAQQQAASKSANPGTAGTTTTTTAPTTKGAPTTTAATTTAAPPPTATIARAAPVTVQGGPTEEQNEKMIGGLDDLDKSLRRRGIILSKSFLTTDYQKSVRDAMYDALSQALYEFAVLTNMTAIDDWVKTSQKYNVAMGVGLKGMVPLMQAAATQGGHGYSVSGNAAGGMVTGISRGLANISPAPNEGLASIGVGERIVPAGSGDQTVKVQLELKGDMLNQIIKARATEAAADHDYKKRFR